MSAEDLMVRFPRFDEWISGATQPTIRQLERFASTTHTPVGYLFLDKPPDEPLPLRDFRRRGTSVARTASADLLDTIYDCQRRQEWYRDFAVSTGAGEVPVVGALTIESDPVDGGRQLRDALAFPVGTRGSTWSETLSRLSEHAEQLGILVMISGVVGNNTHRVLDPQEFGGSPSLMRLLRWSSSTALIPRRRRYSASLMNLHTSGWVPRGSMTPIRARMAIRLWSSGATRWRLNFLFPRIFFAGARSVPWSRTISTPWRLSSV